MTEELICSEDCYQIFGECFQRCNLLIGRGNGLSNETSSLDREQNKHGIHSTVLSLVS